MTPFKTLCNNAGLYSVQEVVDYLNIRPATCREYWYGEKPIPVGIVSELYDEYRFKLTTDQRMESMTLEQMQVFVRGAE